MSSFRHRFSPGSSPSQTQFLVVTLLAFLVAGCGDSPAPEPDPADVEVSITPEQDHSSASDSLPSPEEPMRDEQPKARMQPPMEPPAVSRPELDDAELLNLGIRTFRSPHVILRTDAVTFENEEELRSLPELTSELLETMIERLEKYAPSLPIQARLPVRSFIMEDLKLFVQADLAPLELREMLHGVYRDQTFWMREQATDYYRRHLFFHESIHCLLDIYGYGYPVWFHEGMAELYAVHRITPEGSLEFGIVPGSDQVEGGFGRIANIHREIEAGRFRTLEDVITMSSNEFYPHQESYAWAWAICRFLADDQLTSVGFENLLASVNPPQFRQQLEQNLSLDSPRLRADWAVFATTLEPDFEPDRMLIQWDDSPARPLAGNVEMTVQADRNWQPAGVVLKAGQTCRISAAGQFQINDAPKPWISEPQGVSAEYVDGHPVGQLQAVVFNERVAGEKQDYGFLNVIPIGREGTITSETGGELFLRVNDRPSSWSNNAGAVSVHVELE
ncbi:hypothetical protein [Rubinisphaera margarita]|uniref:hypothetical protein n=1 Tax=Rubinisphaera margarita TaxID=2909586 RepID=UPI001EE82986|nr:hypothetical protein [Rubinisphaera margarita]MCG6155508.1 hypothetical protein [Rubinisphaera margarita]